MNVDVDSFLMGTTFVVASNGKTKNPRACCIVDENNKIISSGVDSYLSETSKEYLSHAELEAICGTLFKDASIYITDMPCSSCLSLIIKSGIKRAVYYKSSKLDQKTIKIAKSCNFLLEEFKGNLNWIRDRIDYLDIFWKSVHK